MALDSKHPEYDAAWSQWESMRDFYNGEDAVKARGDKYLPPTSGMVLDGMKIGQPGFEDYQAYKLRTPVPDYVDNAIELLLGLLHSKAATIQLPAVMESLRENCTINGESMAALMMRINVEQLITGRLGLLADLPIVVPVAGSPLPYLALYTTESVINWDVNTEQDGIHALNLVVLDESRKVRTDFVWKDMRSFRVLQLGEIEANEADDSGAIYTQGLFDNLEGGVATYNEEDMKPPTYRGNTLQQIPFVIINTKDVLSEPDKPPLLALQKLCELIYRGEADYRQNLHMQSQDTLVVKGGIKQDSNIPGRPDVLRTGAGARIDVDIKGDAKYIGVSSLGLPEQRIALANDRVRASLKAGELIQSIGSQKESGVALQTRFTAQTATLNQIALTGALGLQTVLRIVAGWIGANPAEVVITPNTEFVDFGLDGANFFQIMQAKGIGLPLSLEEIHAQLADRGLTKLDFTTEMKKIQMEKSFTEAVTELTPTPPTPATKPAFGDLTPAKPAPSKKSTTA